MTEAQPHWSYRLAREEVPEEGLHIDIEADETVRAALARAAGLRALPRLAASFDVTRTGRDGLHVAGEVTSIVGQDCVVTLEPIEQNLLEPIDLTFVPTSPGSAAEAAAETSVGGDETEPPDAMTSGAVDLGAIATEYFLLGIDPYPRKPGAVFEAPSAGESAENPFAALAALKKPKPGERG
jgi:uncharacterized metal-binding protein YceD (DUF177 family)